MMVSFFLCQSGRWGYHTTYYKRNTIIMKKTLLLAVFAFLSIAVFAQSDSGFGIKAGLNYNANGDYFESASDIAREPDRNIGFHAGVFGKIKILRLYIRPELF